MRNITENKDKIFIVKDLTGRGFAWKLTGSEIIEQNKGNEDLEDFINRAEFGDEYKNEDSSEKYIHI